MIKHKDTEVIWSYKLSNGKLEFRSFNKKDCPKKVWDVLLNTKGTFDSHDAMITDIMNWVGDLQDQVNSECEKYTKEKNEGILDGHPLRKVQ